MQVVIFSVLMRLCTRWSGFMAKKRRFESRCVGGSFIFALIICIFSGLLFAEEQNGSNSSQVSRYRVFALKNIPGLQGKEFLENVGIGTVSLLPTRTDTILVTASQADLVKVTSILELIDSKTEYTYGAICSAEELSAMPTSKQLEKAVGGIAVGTLLDPPPLSAPVKSIVDVHNEKVVAIAPVSEYDKIAVAVMQFGKTVSQGVKAAEANEAKAIPDEFGVLLEPEQVAVPPQKALEPNKAVETKKGTEAKKESNSGEDFFGKLMNKLDEAEKAEAEKQTAEKFAKARQKYEAAVAEKARETPEANVPAAKVAKPVKAAEVNQISEAAEKPVSGAIKISYEPEPNLPAADETLDLNLPESLEIVQLLTLVGDYLHLDYMYDPSKVTGAVTLKLRGPIKVKELYPLVESVLKFKGFVMTRKGNLVTIVPMGEALDIDPALLKEDGKVRYGDVIVTKFFNLQYLSTDNAKNLLDGMKLSVNITPIPETGTLIVTGYTYRMDRIDEILSIIDKPGPPKQFRFRALKYTMAETLAPKVKSLVEQLGEISITVGVSTAPTPAPTPARRRPQPARAQPPVAEGGRPSVYLDADERTNRILMIGFEEQLNTVEELIDSLDIAKQDLRAIRLYDIQHVGAEEVKNKLIELGIIGGELQAGAYRTTQQTRITRQQQQQPQPATAPQAEGAALSVTEQPVVVIIESTNSLLVNATPEQHDQVASIISYVDTETLERAVPYEIYYLENQDPKDLAEVLTKLIQETVKDKEGKVESVVKKTEEEIVIVPDENTFAIIVYASKKNQEWIKKLITSLDRRRPQVLIDVTLVEITKTDSFEYDLNIIGAAAGVATSVKNNALLPPFLSDANASKPGNRFELKSNPADKGGQVFYNNKHVQALLTAIQSKSYGRVLAKPKILVDDGSEGSISTINETTYQKQTVQVVATGTDAIQATDFVSVQAKIELKITPHISEGELLRLDVSMLRDDFGTRPSDFAPPDKTSSIINTTVFVPDDRTIILGGLVKLNQGKGGSKVPILGDIPLVGMLFRSVNNSDVESKLYVFLKANIVRPTTEGRLRDLQTISQKHREAFEKGEETFQTHQDLPGIKPKPVPPTNVLDEL